MLSVYRNKQIAACSDMISVKLVDGLHFINKYTVILVWFAILFCQGPKRITGLNLDTGELFFLDRGCFHVRSVRTFTEQKDCNTDHDQEDPNNCD